MTGEVVPACLSGQPKHRHNRSTLCLMRRQELPQLRGQSRESLVQEGCDEPNQTGGQGEGGLSLKLSPYLIYRCSGLSIIPLKPQKQYPQNVMLLGNRFIAGGAISIKLKRSL